MAELRPDQVRARIAATLQGLVLTTGTAGTLHEAPCDPERIVQDTPVQRLHLAFGVLVRTTNPLPTIQRQRQGRPLRVMTTVSVYLLHKQRKTDMVLDRDYAAAAESEAIVAVIGTSGSDGLEVTYDGTPLRQSNPTLDDRPGSILTQIDFLATHNVATA